MMKILHSGTLDIKYGGPALSTYLTIKGLQANQVNAEMLMAPLTNKKDLIANDVKIHYTSPTLETSLWIHSISKDLIGKYALI